MRTIILAALFTIGCGGTDPMNRMVPTGANYPDGPYGYSVRSIIGNLSFLVKADPDGAAGTATYSSLDPKTIQLSDYFNDPNVSWLVLNGSAGWCGPCREEASYIPKDQAKYEPMGVRFVSVLIQGFDEANQTPATTGDIDHWQLITHEHIAIGTDPQDNLHDYASMIASFPLNIIVRTSDMQIMYSQLGLDSTDPDIGSVLAGFVK